MRLEQPDMFGGKPTFIDVEPRKRARRADPTTSHEAAARVHEFAGNHCDMVLKALKKFGKAGAEQIAGATRLDAYSVRKRLADLEHEGLAAPTPEKRQTVSGRHERVWTVA